MLDFFTHLFSTDGFMPRWNCGLWSDGHGWLHILSDLGVWSAYVAIPCVLVFFAVRKRDLPFRNVFWLFGAFILACGTTHLIEAIIFWWPAYRLAGLIKLLTALVSWGTVVALVPITPRALAMRTPEELEREIEERKRAERALRQLHEELEQRVGERTAELAQANQALQMEIAERRRTEEILREQREWFQVTLSSIGDAVIATDAFGDVSFLNPCAEKLTGWTSLDAVGQPLEAVFNIINEDTRATIENPVAQVLRENVVAGLANHTVLISKDGVERPIDDSAAPILGAEGMVHGVVMVFHDITERRRNERTVRFLTDASAVLNRIVDHETALKRLAQLAVPFFGDWCVVYELKENGRVERIASVHANPEKQALIDDMHQRYDVDTRAKTPLNRVLASGEPELIATPSDADFDRAAQDGEHRQMIDAVGIKSHLSVPISNHNRLFGVLAFTLTEAERHFRPADMDLAMEVARRAAVALENVHLYREVREADRRKDEFLAMLAHELRNPLAPIANALALMKIDRTDADTIDWSIDMIHRQVEHMVRLVDDLLDVSRIMRGKIDLRKQPAELASIVARAVETAQPMIDTHRHTLTVSLPESPVWLDADSIRLAQVIANLLNNACKYTDEGGHIEILAEHQADGLTLRVRDNGIGMDVDLLPRVFDLFTQADRSVARSQGGLGIGLTLARSLVEMHGGTITAHSEGAGRGSEFVIHLATLGAFQGDDTRKWQPRQVPRRRVLVVEDNVGAAQVLCKLLQRIWGHEVEVVHDGLSALEAARRHRPEIVLLDIGLPGLSGYAVARQLRQQPEFEQTLLAALTGYGQEEDRRQSHEAGFDEHLVKPPPISALEALFSHPKLDGVAT